MNQISIEIKELVSLGKEAIFRGQYEKAYEYYNKSLEYDSDHYYVRNALGEIYFVRKDFLSAADNFWLAAVDQASRINIDLINNNDIKDFKIAKKREKEVLLAQDIILDYAKKSGLSLFANQYEDPLKKNAQQALINLFRQKIDPCGYLGYTDASPDVIARIDRNVQMIGYRFLKQMNIEKLSDHKEDFILEELLTKYKQFF